MSQLSRSKNSVVHVIDYLGESLKVTINFYRCSVSITPVKIESDLGSITQLAAVLVSKAWKGTTLDQVIEDLKREDTNNGLLSIIASLLAEDFD